MYVLPKSLWQAPTVFSLDFLNSSQREILYNNLYNIAGNYNSTISKVKAALWQSWGNDPTFASFIAQGAGWEASPTYQTLITDAVTAAINPGQNYALATTKLADAIYQIMAIYFHQRSNAKNAAIYHANYGNVIDAPFDCAPLIWTKTFDFTQSNGAPKVFARDFTGIIYGEYVAATGWRTKQLVVQNGNYKRLQLWVDMLANTSIVEVSFTWSGTMVPDFMGLFHGTPHNTVDGQLAFTPATNTPGTYTWTGSQSRRALLFVIEKTGENIPENATITTITIKGTGVNPF